MQADDLTLDDFSIEALEARFEMEALVEPPQDASWKSTCSYASLFSSSE